MIHKSEISSIKLVLDNFELIEIQREHIISLNLYGIQNNIDLHSEYNTVESVMFGIQAEANKTEDMQMIFGGTGVTRKPLDRLMEGRGITKLYINYANGDEIYYYTLLHEIIWDGKPYDSTIVGNYQTTEIAEDGNLYICISSGNSAKEY